LAPKAFDSVQALVNAAVAYRASRWVGAFLELNTLTRTRGEDWPDRPRLLHRIQTYLTPGFNVHPRPGVTFRTGIPSQ
jgi:hypothetical protein